MKPAVNDTTLAPVGIDPTWSVNELLRLYPSTGRVLNDYGIDTCCGGGDSLEDAARAANLDPGLIVRVLGVAIGTGAR